MSCAWDALNADTKNTIPIFFSPLLVPSLDYKYFSAAQWKRKRRACVTESAKKRRSLVATQQLQPKISPLSERVNRSEFSPWGRLSLLLVALLLVYSQISLSLSLPNDISNLVFIWAWTERPPAV